MLTTARAAVSPYVSDSYRHASANGKSGTSRAGPYPETALPTRAAWISSHSITAATSATMASDRDYAPSKMYQLQRSPTRRPSPPLAQPLLQRERERSSSMVDLSSKGMKTMLQQRRYQRFNGVEKGSSPEKMNISQPAGSSRPLQRQPPPVLQQQRAIGHATMKQVPVGNVLRESNDFWQRYTQMIQAADR
jgi:hypothetical protein